MIHGKLSNVVIIDTLGVGAPIGRANSVKLFMC